MDVIKIAEAFRVEVSKQLPPGKYIFDLVLGSRQNEYLMNQVRGLSKYPLTVEGEGEFSCDRVNGFNIILVAREDFLGVSVRENFLEVGIH